MTPEQHVESAVEAATQLARGMIAETVGYDVDGYEYSKCESPLERSFYIWWSAYACAQMITSIDHREICLVAQHEATTGGYRLDFLVSGSDPDLLTDASSLGVAVIGIAVELDGHDFHERTKEQVALRDRRDRDLQMAGWRVFHFSGSEFHADPLRCVSLVFDYATRVFIDLEIAVHKAKMGKAAPVDNHVDGGAAARHERHR